MSIEPWLPKNQKLAEGVDIKYLQFTGDKWQIYRLSDRQNMLIVSRDLATFWENKKLLHRHIWKTTKIEGIEYLYFVSSSKYNLAPLDYMYYDVDKLSALAFAASLRESRKLAPDVSFEGAIYVEKFSRLLPINDFPAPIDDELILGKWLTGGVAIPTKSIRRLQSLTPFFTFPDLEEIVNRSGVELKVASIVPIDKTQKKSSGDFQSPKSSGDFQSPKSDKFTLPGASYLEKFFYENVIDIVLHPEKYAPLGIDFPAPIILHGKPGTGKTYAVEKLAEFLDWPVYDINSQSIASTYIHQTAQKISEVFNKAFDTAPAIVVIDEMEAYLSKRDFAHDHKIEEIAEFLRLIPEASKNNVLVVGMTNLFENIDPAILRTGRFDHKIEVLMPKEEDIKAMLDNALEKLPVEDDIDFKPIIEYLTDKPRSDTTFIIKEAARLTAFKGKTKISKEEFEEALQTKMTATGETKKSKVGFL